MQLEMRFGVGWVVPSALGALAAALVHHGALQGLLLDSSCVARESVQMSVTVLMCSALADGQHLVETVKAASASGCASHPPGLESSCATKSELMIHL